MNVEHITFIITSLCQRLSFIQILVLIYFLLVQEMKLQCDEKRCIVFSYFILFFTLHVIDSCMIYRETFEYMVGQVREKGKLRHGKGETFTSQQLQVVSEEYDDAARLCVFRVESLKQGQSRSLLTQAARHHAAQVFFCLHMISSLIILCHTLFKFHGFLFLYLNQLNFFRKGFQSLEAVEPHIRNVAEKQHIDYELCEPSEGEKGDDESNSFETNDYGELSFDYRQNELELDNAGTSSNSMEVGFLS